MTVTAKDIYALGQKYNVAPGFIRAIMVVESDAQECAWRTEVAYRYLWNVHSDSPFRSLKPEEINNEKAPADFPYLPSIGSRNTEWMGQQASWGPMQIMGAVAREHGFRGYFPELCGVIGVQYGTLHLSKLMSRFFDKHGYAGVAAAYNAGSVRFSGGHFENQGYVDKVLNVFRDM